MHDALTCGGMVCCGVIMMARYMWRYRLVVWCVGVGCGGVISMRCGVYGGVLV